MTKVSVQMLAQFSFIFHIGVFKHIINEREQNTPQHLDYTMPLRDLKWMLHQADIEGGLSDNW